MCRENSWDAIQNVKGAEMISANLYNIMYNRKDTTRLWEIPTNSDNTKHDGMELMEKL